MELIDSNHMTFQFFNHSINERRSYLYSSIHIELIQRTLKQFGNSYPEARIKPPKPGPLSPDGYPSIEVSHIVAPPGNGLEAVEGKFGICLPTDIKEFYRLHNEALILTRNPVLIMNPEQIISVSDELREAHEIPSSLPRHVIRFGWLGTDSYFLLRFDEATKQWEVMISSYSHATDAELQNRTAWGTACDKSFTDWLRRMIETDGVPLHPDHIDDEEDYFVKRIA